MPPVQGFVTSGGLKRRASRICSKLRAEVLRFEMCAITKGRRMRGTGPAFTQIRKVGHEEQCFNLPNTKYYGDMLLYLS